MLTYLRTSIFDSPAQTLVNTVNTMGVMGKGIAKEFKARHPRMFRDYKELCDHHQLKVGVLHLWRGSKPWVLNFPTKTTWRQPSKIEYVEAGLQKFRSSYERMGITSASFPPLGCGNGNLDWHDVRPLMERYLKALPIPVYIHDRQVGPDFVPEHQESSIEEAPGTFKEFLVDINTRIAACKGRFRTLRDRTPFHVTVLMDHTIRIQRESGKIERLISAEELEDAWAMLQTGLLTSDQYTDDASRRYKSYIFSILSALPYVQVAGIERTRDGNKASGHALFFKPPSHPQYDLAVDEVRRRNALCPSQ
jgi:O-acetyl-ADP-ribose deacetylase (regulator of RNase III)